MAVVYDSSGFAQRVYNGDDALKALLSKQEDEPEVGETAMDKMLGFEKDRDVVFVIIGNGFDLECGLPTTYGDFLRFLEVISKGQKGAISLNDKVYGNLLKKKFTSKNFRRQWRPVFENFWYKYFIEARIKQNWVDFEKEIARVITMVENNTDLTRFHRFTMEDYVAGYESDTEMNHLLKLLHVKRRKTEKNPNGSDYIEYNILHEDLRNKLLQQLDAFILGLEKYLDEYVETIPVTPSANILFLMNKLKSAKRGYVISFNYTKTFERMITAARIKAEFCYIHGKVDPSTNNNMVLGIDEHLNEEGIKNLIGFAPFRKYFQRILKSTDSRYIDWLEEEKAIESRLYVFGHSLGITDKDIIQSFIKAPLMETMVFYHGETSLNSQIINLTAIIGMKEMVQRTGGKYRTLRFEKQK